jgi:branched-subunit amino acid aminotransferase/4-amino-4-deoxychorismate lyase
VPTVSRGLMYGDGVFETFRTYSGQTLFLNEHLQRLSEGLEILNISQKPALKPEPLKSLVYELLKKQELLAQDAIVRLQVWRDGCRGFNPDPKAGTHFSITASHCPNSFDYPHLSTVNTRRIPSSALPSHCKFTNSINYILASQQATKKDSDGALMQTQEGWISETTIANIFWVTDNHIFTPSAECDLIPGITRKIVLDLLANDDRWSIEQGKFQLKRIQQADAVWMCNSVREILPVAQIEGQAYDTEHPVLLSLAKQFRQFKQDNLIPLHP